jgi:acyl carrier protein
MALADDVRASIISGLKLEEIGPEHLQAETRLFGPQGVGLDSIDALELVTILKRDFKIDIQQLDRKVIEKAFQSFGALVEFVASAPKK